MSMSRKLQNGQNAEEKFAFQNRILEQQQSAKFMKIEKSESELARGHQLGARREDYTDSHHDRWGQHQFDGPFGEQV